MKKNLHDIDNLFKTALDGQEETPSQSAWDAIDQQLDKNKVVDINRKYEKLKRVAVVLLVLLLGIGAYTLNTWNKSQKMAKQDKIRNIHTQKKEAGNINQSEQQADKIHATDAGIDNKKIENEITGLSDTENTVEKNKQDAAGKINPGTRNKNSSATPLQKSNEMTANSSSSKIIIKKGKPATTITNAGYGTVENETVSNNSTEKDNKPKNNISIENNNDMAAAFTNLPPANPVLITPSAFYSIKKPVISGSAILPAELTMNPLPAKAMKTKKTGSFTATVFVAPGFSSNHFTEEKNVRRPGGPRDNRDREKIKEGEQHQTAFTFGVLAEYKMNPHWSLQSGVSISNKSISIDPKTIYAHVDNNGAVKYLYDCSSGYLFLSSKSVNNPVVGDSIHTSASTNTLQYLSVPLGIRYNYSFNKIELFTSVGTSFNILTKGKIETGLESGNNKEETVSTKINGLKPGYLSGNIGIGAAYSITDRMAISFTPTYNFALTSSTKDAAVKSYPNSFSLAAGIRFKL